jgi:NRAMP (natural resistance-associated macrophage protein)-like metal ion transporter
LTAEGEGEVPATERSPVDTTTAAAQNPVWRQYLRAIGPGLVTGASDDDPSAIATYASAGARAGFGLLWTSVVAFPLIVAVQINADRTALATGRSLGELARDRFRGVPRRLFLALMVVHMVGNTVVLAADLMAVGAGFELLVGGRPWLWALAAGAGITLLVLQGSFARIAAVLKILCLALLAYVGVLAVIDVDWGAVVSATIIPRLDGESARLLLPVLGATLPPYVFFWQSAHRLEEMREEPQGGDRPVPLGSRRPGMARRTTRTSEVDVVCGMLFAVVVMFAVMIASAAAGAKGTHSIQTAADVARALEPVAGSAAGALFGVGFIAAGVLAVPVLAGSGSAALAGFLGRDWGFSRSVPRAPVFYGLVAVGTVTGTVLSLVGVDPIQLLVTAATVNGLTSAPLLVVVMLIAGDRTLMGEHRPAAALRGLGWLAVAVMGSATVGLVISVI